MEIICPNVILFGYDTEHMFENYQMKIFLSHSDTYISKKYGIFLDFSL